MAIVGAALFNKPDAFHVIQLASKSWR